MHAAGPGAAPYAAYAPRPVDAFRILFVCTGNVCRSPIAERLTRPQRVAPLGGGAPRGGGGVGRAPGARGRARAAPPPPPRGGGPAGGGPPADRFVVESAGTWGHEGAPMEAHAATVLGEYGVDSGGFAGRELLDEHVIDADLVLTATLDHRAQVISMGHKAGLRTFTLKEFTRLVRRIDPGTLPDPRGGARLPERARALVRSAAALRGWLLAASPESDEVDDPYGAPIGMFRNCGEEIFGALDPVVTALTGVRGRP
ncbi:protein-tyrosine-phosphatase [Kitasatospora sp. NPDC059571]|uniref:arsenate reductase/protein-tyrosine-phosphatase family protein n=1 Tax=Kitasatospora sp. NPDC059571 TaxID=3346871 RepID=UPI0036CC7C8B